LFTSLITANVLFSTIFLVVHTFGSHSVDEQISTVHVDSKYFSLICSSLQTPWAMGIADPKHNADNIFK